MDFARIDAAAVDFLSLTGTLNADVSNDRRALKTTGGDQARRTVVRSGFAMIEGTCHALKQLALLAQEEVGVTLSRAELSLLREESYALSDAGKAEIRAARLRTQPNIRFALEMFAKAEGVSFSVKSDDPGWIALTRALKMRDRITHPRQHNQLCISDAELDDLYSGLDWFSESVGRLFGEAAGVVAQKRRELQEL